MEMDQQDLDKTAFITRQVLIIPFHGNTVRAVQCASYIRETYGTGTYIQPSLVITRSLGGIHGGPRYMKGAL